jgi:uncharacterized protein YdhG (YjbR/CyaY superfamily)
MKTPVKKASSGRPPQRPPATDLGVSAYMAALDPAPRAALETLKAIILAEAPDAELRMSYGMPSVRWAGRLLVYFAAFKDHCSLFVGSVAVLEAFAKELGGRRTSKGTIQFTVENPLPVDLVRRLVMARLAENAARAKK